MAMPEAIVLAFLWLCLRTGPGLPLAHGIMMAMEVIDWISGVDVQEGPTVVGFRLFPVHTSPAGVDDQTPPNSNRRHSTTQQLNNNK